MDLRGSPGEPVIPEMRWWGWGRPDHPQLLGDGALRELRERLQVHGHPSPPVALDQVRLPPSRLNAAGRSEIERLLGTDRVLDGHRARVLHAGGKGYLDLVRLRGGQPQDAPDAVVMVDDHDKTLALLALCSRLGIAVVPFGGGTSVVGGLAGGRGEHEAVIALDLAGMSGVGALDEKSLTVRAGAGTRVASLERELKARGLTLGHFPQSFEYVSLGGCAATRSVGQGSTGYGRFDQMVIGLRAATPAGAIDLPAMPASAAGPDLRQLLLGSEGTLGVIDTLTLRLRHAPRARRYEGLMFGSFEEGADALRKLAQEGCMLTLARLSDAQETELTMALASEGMRRRATDLYLAARRRRHGCLAIVGCEGGQDRVDATMDRALSVCRRHGALPLGVRPGEAWVASRFSAPYMRDELITHGIMVETLETATVWSNLHPLHAAVERAITKALAALGTPPIVGCHVSHLYETGASLYFTFLARSLVGEEERQWRAAKEAASEAIVQRGGTISHHHGVGADHATWLAREIGAQGVAALRAAKAELDPAGILNPRKVLPEMTREG